MGKHFDTLVELVRNHVAEEENAYGIPIRKELVRAINNAKLFEFPFASTSIRPKTGTDDIQGYNAYLDQYFNLSKQYGVKLILPFNLTAIEDNESVVIIENKKINKKLTDTFRVFVCGNYGDSSHIIGSNVKILDNFLEDIKLDVQLFYHLGILNGKRMPGVLETGIGTRSAMRDTAQAVTTCIEELIYIMDPSRFVLCRESNASIVQREKNEKKKKREILLKTVMRPHFIFLEADELKDFIHEQAKEPYPAHPVVGHWRTLTSERYKNMRNQTIFVRQHWQGEGYIIGVNGWNYQVYVKESPVRMVPYTREKNLKLPKPEAAQLQV